MKKKFELILFILLVVFVYGCSSNGDTLPDIDIPFSEMNKELELVPNPGGGLIARNNEYYDFQIKNLADHTIIFPNDYGVKLYTKQENEWCLIENGFTYPEGNKVLPLANEFPPGLVVAILPYVFDMDQEEIIRVVIIGYPENSSDQSVGAYYDLTLNP